MTEEANIASLLAQNTPDAAARLNELAQTTPDKAARKAARRALYLLAQKGIVPPAPVASAPAPHGTVISSGLQAWASAFDGAGNRLLFLTWPDRDGGSPSFLQCLISDVEGVRDTESRRVSRRELADRLKGFEAQLEAGIALAPIETDYGRFLLHQARQLSQQARRATPPGFLDLLRGVGIPPASFAHSPVWDTLPLDAIRNDSNLPRDPAALFALPWFDAWFLDVNEVTDWLAPIVEQLNRGEEAADVLAQSLGEAAHTCANALFSGGLKAQYIHRLEESADILRRRGLTTPARQALFHADALRAAQTGADSPFAVTLIKRTMQAALEMASKGAMQG